jgi:hypothetical protein
MRKILGVFTFLVCLTGASVVYAHPASDINITFDQNTRMLLAVITHNVGNPENHYIDKVDITLNGNEIIAHAISRQDNNVGQTVSYLIPDAKEGDVIAVDTNCSKGGKLKKEIKVGAKN